MFLSIKGIKRRNAKQELWPKKVQKSNQPFNEVQQKVLAVSDKSFCFSQPTADVVLVIDPLNMLVQIKNLC